MLRLRQCIAYKLIITPHAAFYCREVYHELRYKAARTALRVLEGKPLRNCVNMQWLKNREKGKG
ncbi:MAG: hypothetical protein H8E87_01580 [FCB group bacterium]|nr:hypothetical protein [FCB group bacterium]